MGGSGVQVPYNIFAWVGASLLILVSLARVYLLGHLKLHVSTFYYLLALVFILFPLFYTDRLFLDVETFRLLGMAAGVLFLVALQQFFNDRFGDCALNILLLSAVIQSAWGLVQYYFIFDSSPLFWSAAKGAPYGVFQQVNVFAIYTAMGSMLVLRLVSLPTGNATWIRALAAVLIFANAHLAVLSGANSALVVSFVSVVVYLVYLSWTGYIVKRLALMFFACLLAGALLPKSWVDIRPTLDNVVSKQIQHQGSGAVNTQSINVNEGYALSSNESKSPLGTRPTIYRTSVEMFLESPWVGHGIGSFRKQYLLYQGEYLKEHPDAPAEFNLSHPHNELLYWAVELGFLPLVGFLIIGLGWYSGVRTGALELKTLLAALPLVLQSLLELPFYHSVAHYLAFMLILVAACKFSNGIKTYKVPRWTAIVSVPLSLWGAFKAWMFLFSTYYALMMFLLFNASGRENVSYLLEVNNPSAFKLRYEFELFQWKLREARKKGEFDVEELNNYLRWAFSTVQYAPMQTTYENFVASLVLINKKEAARRYLDEALLIYPNNQKLKEFDRQLRALEVSRSG